LLATLNGMQAVLLRLSALASQVVSTVRDDFVEAAVSSRSTIGWIGALRFVLCVAIVLRLRWGVDYVDEQPKWLPAKVFLTRSTWQDLGLVLVNATLFAAGGLVLSIEDAGSRITSWIQSTLSIGSHAFAAAAPMRSRWAVGIGAAVVLLSMDFAAYWWHRMMHRLPSLWEFHKVHHSATVLSPFTSFREHALEPACRVLATALTLGVTTGLLRYVLPKDQVILAIAWGASAYGYAFACVLLLNHSHVWWSWGSLEYVLNSPAMHLIHHSRDPAHFNKNMGNLLAIWDVIFGTHHRTTRALVPIRLGVDDGLEWQRASQVALFVRPFARLVAAGRARNDASAGPTTRNRRFGRRSGAGRATRAGTGPGVGL
jgi:sterol desaturase/sphingolipid hydroxylase (fatty acid hydroxylase superfamily)